MASARGSASDGMTTSVHRGRRKMGLSTLVVAAGARHDAPMAHIVSGGRRAGRLPVLVAIAASAAVVGAGAAGAGAWTLVVLGGVAFAVIVVVGERFQRPPQAEPVRPLADTYEQVVVAAPKAVDLVEQPKTHTDAA